MRFFDIAAGVLLASLFYTYQPASPETYTRHLEYGTRELAHQLQQRGDYSDLSYGAKLRADGSIAIKVQRYFTGEGHYCSAWYLITWPEINATGHCGKGPLSMDSALNDILPIIHTLIGLVKAR